VSVFHVRLSIHFWAPDVYQAAPIIGGYIATASKNPAVAILLRLPPGHLYGYNFARSWSSCPLSP
jgi:NADH:ubiquinone oxidoreductase subunit 2 (subunit N)